MMEGEVMDTDRVLALLLWLWGGTDRHYGGPQAFEEAAAQGLIRRDGLWGLTEAGRSTLREAGLDVPEGRPREGVRLTNAERKRRWRQNPVYRESVERDREASRRWKREHLGQPGRPRQEQR